MNNEYPTFFFTWFNKFSQVPYPGWLVITTYHYFVHSFYSFGTKNFIGKNKELTSTTTSPAMSLA